MYSYFPSKVVQDSLISIFIIGIGIHLRLELITDISKDRIAQ